MSTRKRCISFLLVLGILLGVLAPTAQAAPVKERATVNTDNFSIEGTNGFGDLLAHEITENQTEITEEASEYPGGYSVTDLEIVDNVATVTYDSMEEATLVVALHTEDGMQLLTSATVTVTPDATEATVTFGDEMPEYFMASAYLLDQYDFSPLCADYETPMYTQEMQKLLASTADDYDPERVLNMDDDETTNFAVYADSTVIIESVEGKNIVASIDDKNAIYVIKNTDEQITSLTEGSVVVCPYADNEILIIKVASIALDGATATITGAELEMSDVFSYVKIESTADVGKAVIQEGTGDDCVTYNGVQYNGTEMTGQEPPFLPNVFEDEIIIPMPALEFGIEETFEDAEGNKITISGGMKIEADISLQYYIALFSQYVKFQIDTTSNLNFTVAGTVELFEFELPEIDFDLVPQLVSVGSKPQVEVSFNGEIGWEGNVHFTVGFACGNNVPIQDLCTGPWVESKTNLKVGFAVKIDLQPNLSAKATDFLELISARVTCPAGFEVTAEENGQSVVDAYGDLGNTIHTCQNCIKFELFGCVELGAEIVFLDKVKLINKGDGLTITLPFKAKAKIPILSAYYSTDYSDFGFGSCPYESYRLTIEVLDSTDQPVQDASVYTKRELWGNTNKYGILATYVPEGTYELYTIVDEEEFGVTIKITGPDYLKITPNGVVGNGNPGADDNSGNTFGDIDSGGITDRGDTAIATGSCGENLYWELYENGYLYIGGSGDMSSSPFDSELKEKIRFLEIGAGCTAIGYDAFRSCGELETVTIREGCEEIGSSAFAYCDELKTVTIEKGCEEIGGSAFYDCNALTTVTLPNTLTSIGASAFKYCTALSTVNLPATLTEIGSAAFSDCKSLASVILPNSLKALGSAAFASSGLTSINIPGSVRKISYDAFRSCDELEAVIIREGCEEIESCVFAYCDKLNAVYFLGDAPEIASNVFYTVTSTVYYPSGNATWTSDVMLDYGGTITWTPYFISMNSSAITCEEDAFTVTANPDDAAKQEAQHKIDEEAENTKSESTPITTQTTPVNSVMDDIVKPNAVYPGEYDTEITDSYTLKTASFKNLVPSEQYVLLAMASIEVENPLSADNLLFIDQAEALEDGTITFQYVQRIPCDISYVVACGASNKNLNDAVITFPEMVADGELQVIDPTVVYDGVTLTEGRDYVLTGKVDFTEAGEYTCFIRGIHNYTGLVEYVYTVTEAGLANSFIDVPEGSFYYEPVMWAIEKGITNGATATTFNPGGTCLRAQVVTFLHRAAGNPEPGSGNNPFTDVKTGDFFYKPVLWAVEKGITNGTTATTFGSYTNCNRAAVVTFLWRAAGSPEPKSTSHPFVDVKISDFFYESVLWAVENGITNGIDATHFGPTAYCNRAQVVTFLYRAAKINNKEIVKVASGINFYAILRANGKVDVVSWNNIVRSDWCADWTDIVDIDANNYFILGLQKNGSVVFQGVNVSSRGDVGEWSDIKQVSAGAFFSVGLKTNGTIVAAGSNDDGECNVSDWTGIIAISAGSSHTVGLKADGTVVATGSNHMGQCDVAQWSDIIAIAAGDGITVGLKADGTVVTTCVNWYYNSPAWTDIREAHKWTDVVAIDAGRQHIVALKSDGTVATAGFVSEETHSWCDVAAISAGGYHTIGLKKDGTILIVQQPEGT